MPKYLDPIGREGSPKITFVVDRQQQVYWLKAAKRVGMTQSEFIRACCDEKADQINKSAFERGFND